MHTVNHAVCTFCHNQHTQHIFDMSLDSYTACYTHLWHSKSIWFYGRVEEQVSFFRYTITVAQKWTDGNMFGPEWWYKLNLPWVVHGFSLCLFGFLAHSLCVWARFLKHTSNGWMTSEAGCQLNFKNSLASLSNLKCLTLCWAWLELQPYSFPWLISECKGFM